MAVKLRLKRVGRTHRSCFRLAAMESRNPRDGRVLEELGSYDPTNKNPDAQVVLRPERIQEWIRRGATPTPTVRDILKKHGIKI